MILINELKNLMLYKKAFYLPFDPKNKMKNNIAFLLTPNYESTKELLNNPLLIRKQYSSYYIEKDITYFINEEGYAFDMKDIPYNVLNESLRSNMVPKEEHPLSNYLESDDVEEVITSDNKGINSYASSYQFMYQTQDYHISESYMRAKVDNNDVMFIFNENLNEQVLNENKEYNTMLHKILYEERFKNSKEVFDIYAKVEQDFPWIKKTYINYERYEQLNLLIDLSFYNQTFFKNNIYKLDKGVDLYFEFISRFINDKRLDVNGYTNKTIFIPIEHWSTNESKIYNFTENINPISMINRMLRTEKLSTIQEQWKDLVLIFISNTGYFKVAVNDLEDNDYIKINTLIDKLKDKNTVIQDDNIESPKAIVANIVDKIEDSQGIKINNLTGDGGEIQKDELVKKIEDAASKSSSTDDAIDNLEEDPDIKKILADLAAEEENNVKINAARTARINKLQDEFLNKKLNNTTVKAMIEESKKHKEIPSTKLEIDSVNEEWKDLKYINFESIYNPQEDILAMLNSLASKTVPVSVRDINIEDTSTSEDYIETWNVQMEDSAGTRFTIKFDIPKLINNRFMKLRGNEKTINGQLMLLPITKSDKNITQIVSNYNKIFIEVYGKSRHRSFIISDRIIKALEKEGHKIKYVAGDNEKICNKYELPIDYIDIASFYSKIETKEYIFFFNQDELRSKYKVDLSKGLPIGIEKDKGTVIYYSTKVSYSELLLSYLIMSDSGFEELYNSASTATKYAYSKASILSTDIPVVVIMAYNEGLTKALKKANIKFDFSEKKPQFNKSNTDIIKFNDGFLVYDLEYHSSLLMNGLKECNTEDYSLKDINNRSMWLDFLDLFGGRLRADGLDNFYDLMIDPITQEVLQDYKLPEDYTEILAYANMLLSDNKYIKHTDITGNRYRTNELIAGYFYKALSDSYSDYRNRLKKMKNVKMTMKQSAVIDLIMSDPTSADKSDLNALLEMETKNSVGFKGLSGMNSDRSYDLSKRTFDESMLNVLGMSTGFAGNVGLVRQTTMDMNIQGKRGYIKTISDPNQLNVSQTFTATEGVTPFGATRDDPFRSAMTFIQTSKHAMRTKHGSPLLISTGADEAMPYMISDTFAFKAKNDGKVVKVTEEYMVIKYKDGSNDFVDLRSTIKKNSNGGFYISIKLDSDLKEGANVKANQILAYDKLSFSDMVGHTNNIAYNIGTYAKIALITTDEGFEDSAAISEYLSEAMSSEVVVEKDIALPANTNIYNMVKKGQEVEEGEPLLIFQNAFEEEDVNMLLKNLVGDDEAISELGRIKIKSKITGVVEDIKVYRTVEKDELSDSLKKKVNEIEKPIGDMKKIMKQYDIEYANRFDADYKLNTSGKLKKLDAGVLVEFFLKYEDRLSVGDKIVYYSALKGVIKYIFPKGEEPYTDFRPNEKIHSLLSESSNSGRMVGSVPVHLGITKVLVELDRAVKDIAGIPWKSFESIIAPDIEY